MSATSGETRRTPRARVRGMPWGTLGVAALALAATAWPRLGVAWVGERAALEDGAPWLAWTAHLAHFSWSHVLWSGLVWVAAAGALERMNRRAWALLWLGGAPLVTWAALAADPALARYGGLSGLACAPVAWLGLHWVAGGKRRGAKTATNGESDADGRDSQRVLGVALLVGLAAKIGLDWQSAGAVTLADLGAQTGGALVRGAWGAHAAGALVGAALWAVCGGRAPRFARGGELTRCRSAS